MQKDNISNDELLKKFDVSPQEGLSDEQIDSCIKEYGYNELTEKKVHPILKFLSFFWGPIPWMIEVAVILSAIVGDWTDLGIILILLIGNSVVGFWEEYQADNAIEALKKKLALSARVRRNGEWKKIPARELVPGDIIRLRLGEIIPADVQLLDGDPIEVDQSALTGESLPVELETGKQAYSGTIVTQGEIESVVYATGKDTFFGKTARMIEEKQNISHFQKAVLKIGDYLIILAVVLVLIILLTAMFHHEHFITALRFALVLTVAAIPVAMPTVLSVTMAVGARLLSAKEAIVRRLASIEELAGMDILCSDKTGTLTQNKLKLDEPVVLSKGVSINDIITAGALASREEDQDPIDLAVLNALEDKETLKNYQILHFQPFDPVHKRTEANVKTPDGKEYKVSKGAPQAILSLLENPSADSKALNKTVNEFAHRGYRSLGVAQTDDQGHWRYLGVLPLYDPPREDSAKTIKQAQGMGVRVKMVTGDQVDIGKEIARQIKMGTNILDATEFGDTKHHESGLLADKIEKADGFAQVFPEHKHHIVEVLQTNGHIVGMTGDGVNDAPALKKADCGIAVSGATDAARSAADIVLMKSGISVIIDAIRESRRIFQRMNSYATYRIAETIRVLLFMTLSILIFQFYPLTAVMIVLLALLNDGAILSIAYDNAVVSPKPDTWNMRLVLGIATLLGIAGVIASFSLFYVAEHTLNINRDIIQTLIYLKLSVAGHLTIFLTRTRKGHFWSERPANVLIAAVLVTQIIATLIAVYGIFMPPIGWKWAGIIWLYAGAWFIVNDFIKIAGYKIFESSEIPVLGTRKHRAKHLPQ